MLLSLSQSTRFRMNALSTAVLMVCVVVLTVVSAPSVSKAQSSSEALREARATVNNAETTLSRLLQDAAFSEQLSNLIRQSRAVLIVPDFFKAGFIVGGSYGNGVLLARGQDGFFSDPAFYRLRAGSVGFQAGIQNAETVMVIMTQAGLDAVLTDQFKGGANLDITFGLIGAGASASTTSDVGEDIYAFSHNVGLFGGAGLEGTAIEPRSDWNTAFYGRSLTPNAILFDNAAYSPDAVRLKNVLAQ